MGAWSTEEEALLRSHYGKTGREELLQLLPLRNYRSIKLKVIKLDLLEYPTEQELRELVQGGFSLRAIGAKYDLDCKTIHRYCRKRENPSDVDGQRRNQRRN